MRKEILGVVSAVCFISAVAFSQETPKSGEKSGPVTNQSEKAKAGAPGVQPSGNERGRMPDQVIHAGRKEGQGKAMRLLILSGQSNMAGMNALVSYLPALEKALPDDELIIVKHSISGQPIRYWYKGWEPVGGWKSEKEKVASGGNRIYVRLMEMGRAEIKERRPDSITFVWMQGEADGVKGQSELYEQSLRGLILQLREDMKRPDITAVIGRINDYQTDEYWNQVREAEVKVAEEDPLCAWVDTDDLNNGKRNSNGLHFLAEGYKVLGERFAEKTLMLIRKK